MAGNYFIENGVLFLKVLLVEQLTDYRIVQPGPTAQYGHFYIEGGKIETIVQKNSKYQDHTLLMEGKEIVMIDDMPYYRLSDNPSAY